MPKGLCKNNFGTMEKRGTQLLTTKDISIHKE